MDRSTSYMQRLVNKADIECAHIGEIQGNPDTSSQVLKLKKLLLTYGAPNGEFQVYNTSEAISFENKLDFRTVFPVSFSPQYPEIKDGLNTTIELDVSETPTGHELLIRVPGSNSQLIVVEVIDTVYKGEPWFLEYLMNKGFIFTVIIMVILAYNLCKTRGSTEDKSVAGLRKTIEKSKSLQESKIDEISEKLAFFEKNTEEMNAFLANTQGAYGEGDLKPTLKMQKNNSSGGSKKNVRFADDFE